MSQINFNTSRRTTGNLERFDCLAWVNFNGTGTVAIRAAGNVSTITDNGVGSYTLNFTNAMPDANYSWPVSAGNATGGGLRLALGSGTSAPTASTLPISIVSDGGGTSADATYVSVAIFR